MFSRYLLCTFTLLVTLSVIPHARAADSFDSIQISIFPPDGGSAYKQLTPDGVVVGQHLSGDAVPRVFESRASIASSDLRQIKQLVTRLVLQKQPKQVEAQTALMARKKLVVVIRGKPQIEEETQWDKPFELNTTQKLWELIAKSRAGAW